MPNVVLRDTAGVFLIEDCKKLAWSCNKLLLRHAPLSRDIKIIEIRLCKDQANAFDNLRLAAIRLILNRPAPNELAADW
jgi:hypothetical protein